jgi:hypothetical protein
MDFHVTSRCNLSCLRCNRFTHVPQKQYPVEAMLEDARTMSACFKVGRLLILGGEPLLQPRLAEILRALREIDLAQELVLVTNGTLCSYMADEVLLALNTLHVSRYPGVLAGATLVGLRRRCESACVKFEEHPVHSFSIQHSAAPTDPVATYSACAMWHCREYREGHLTKCGTAVGINREHGGQWKDSLKVERTPEFAATVQQFLETKAPMKACGNCYGTSRPEPWKQETDRAKLRALNELPP